MWNIFEYQFCLRYQFLLTFSENLQDWSLMERPDFQDPIQKKDFGICSYQKPVFKFIRKCNRQSWYMLFISQYQFPHKHTSTPLNILKSLTLTASVKLFNFEDPTHTSDFGTYCGRTAFHLLKKLVQNQYLEVVTILFPPEMVVPLAISAKLERNCKCSSG